MLNNSEITPYPFFKKFKSLFTERVKKGILKSFNELKEELLILLPEGGMITREELQVALEWYQNSVELKFLEKILESTSSNEIIITSDNRLSYLDVDGWLEKNISESVDLALAFETQSLRYGIHWNYATPFTSFKATVGKTPLRMTLLHHSIDSSNISTLIARKQQENLFPLSSFTSDSEAIKILEELVATHKNIIVSGSTGSGKTALTKSLIKIIPPKERLIILEDVVELGLISRENCTKLLAEEGVPKKSLVDYCAYALRSSPDRIILGEIRSKEVVPLVLSMNTGHRGIISTIHANSSYDTLHRLVTLFSLFSESSSLPTNTVATLVARNIEYVVHLHHKKIVEIAKVIGQENGHFFIETVYSANA